MIYRVQIQPPAERDLEEAWRWAARRAPITATRWLHRFRETLETLSQNPERCSLAPEHRKLKRQLRQLLFGKKPNVFRVIFLVEGETVRILRILRASRRFLERDDLD
jgi:plasmid stabilization system protein ParE